MSYRLPVLLENVCWLSEVAKTYLYQMICILKELTLFVTKTLSLINGVISEKLMFLCMPQNKVIKHFHQYEYDLSPTNYLFKPNYYLIDKFLTIFSCLKQPPVKGGGVGACFILNC